MFVIINYVVVLCTTPICLFSFYVYFSPSISWLAEIAVSDNAAHCICIFLNIFLVIIIRSGINLYLKQENN